MNALWSYALAALGITGLLIAANRPRVGWWFNIAAQTAWVAYALATRQWGFLASALAYVVAYVRLLRRAYRPAEPVKTGPRRARYLGVLVLVATKAQADAWMRDHPEFSGWRRVLVASRDDVQKVRGYFGPIEVRRLGVDLPADAAMELSDAVRVIEAVTQLVSDG